jgi:hypothetical protein
MNNHVKIKQPQMKHKIQLNKPSFHLGTYLLVALFTVAIKSQAQVRPFISIGVVNDCHEYSGNTVNFTWGGMPVSIYETGKQKVLGGSSSLGVVLQNRFVVGLTRYKSSVNGDLGLNQFQSKSMATGLTIIPIITKTNKLRMGAGLNVNRLKQTVNITSDAGAYVGETIGNTFRVLVPLWLDVKMNDKTSFMVSPAYGVRGALFYDNLPVWAVSVGMVFTVGANNSE